MKLYFPEKFYNNDYRWHIFPLLKGLQKEPDKAKVDFQIVQNEYDSDVVILPMSWNYYYAYNKIEEILNYYHELSSNKIVISFVFGDIGYKVPKSFKGIVFRSSGLRSKLPNNHKGFPIFVNDPIHIYFSKNYKIKRPFSTIPVVGFCGQAKGFGIQAMQEIFKTMLKNILSVLGLRNQDTDQLISTTYFRWKILKRLEKSKNISSNFIIRKKYRAGIKIQKETHPTTLEFYNNIKESDYIVCMRGAGNFSSRLYETLAMGRIPVFVNTDCLLPLEDIINWKEHVVLVEYNERDFIAEKVMEFHKSLDETSINALFLKNRKLWENYLQLYSFFNASHYEI